MKSEKWRVESGMWRVECGEWNVECGMWNVECGEIYRYMKLCDTVIKEVYCMS